jgi:hypothetical protein
MFPQLSDIEDKIHYKILSRANAVDSKLLASFSFGSEKDTQRIEETTGLKNTSKLNTWVKAISGAKSKTEKGNGMILQSIQDWEIFNIAGGDRGVGSYYGNIDTNASRSGTIGVNLDGKPIETNTATTDRLLRPSPIISGLEIKEGQDQISRECTLSIKCFTLAQLEIIQTYFMEPGYTLYIEYGWNTPNLKGPIPLTLFGKQTPDLTIIAEAASRGLNYDKLHKLRVDSDGDFDCFLGFIVGGSVSTENEVFNVSVNLRGQPGLPTYLQAQHKSYSLVDGKVVKPDPKIPYDSTELEDIDGAKTTGDFSLKAKQRFKYMFNDLAAQRQNQEVKDLEINNNPLVTLSNFINFDKTIQANIANYTDPNWTKRVKNVIEQQSSDTVTTINSAKVSVEMDKKDLFSSNRFIKMDLAVRILNANSKIEAYTIGEKNVSVKISIDNSVIGAFRYMFSTNPSKLIIPGELPDFLKYFLNADDISHGSIENDVFKAENIVIGKDVYPPTDNSIGGIRFVRSTVTPFSIPYRENAYNWGYLKDLYVNFDMFNSKIKQSNKTIGEVFLDILNEMSSAVNSFWNFQIVESKNKNGDIILTVIDENFVGRPNGKPSDRKSFYHSGIQSPFLESNLDLSIPAEMANKLILSRLSYSSNPDSQFAQGGSFFNSNTDLFLQSVKASNVGTPPPPPPPPSEDEQANERMKKAEAEYLEASLTIAELEKGATQETNINNKDYGLYKFKTDALKIQYEKAIAARLKAQQDYVAAGGKDSLGKKIIDKRTEKAKNTASDNLQKIALLPNPQVITMITDEVNAALKDVDKLNVYFRAYTLNDVTYFDMLKQNAFQDKRNQNNYGLSHPLPITYTFKTMGVSGMRRGDMFVIDGIPSKYKLNGVFQITELEQTVQDSLWTTSVTGKYRQFIQKI